VAARRDAEIAKSKKKISKRFKPSSFTRERGFWRWFAPVSWLASKGPDGPAYGGILPGIVPESNDSDRTFR